MKEKVFKNPYLLFFESPIVQANYHSAIHSKLNTYNKISSPILFLCSFTFIIIIIIEGLKKPKESYVVNFIYILLSFSIISFILAVMVFAFSISHLKLNVKVQIFSSCICYGLTNFQFTIMKIMLEVIYKINADKYFFVNNLEYSIRIMLHFLGIIEFYQSALINILLPGITLVFYYIFDTINSLIFDDGASFIILSLSLIVSSYFVTKNLKQNFYYMNRLKCNYEQQNAIMNKLNTGYMRVKDSKIEFINTSLHDVVTQSKIFTGDPTIQLKPEIIFDILFNWTIDELLRVETEGNENLSLTSMILRKVYWIWKNGIENENKSDFVFIKYQTIELERRDDITYEISCRCNIDKEVEFIFNDITNTKKFEQKQYETKMKDVFLTKISHEFKNPLVCINEIIDQLNESTILKGESKAEVLKKTSSIKSFIDYCFILIYDLDYFTSITLHRPKGQEYISNDRIGIKDLMIFCGEIGKVKLKQENKSKLVSIETNIQVGLPKEIITDGMKLKQILINLMSNAIHCTTKGVIYIKFSNDKTGFITFVLRYPERENPGYGSPQMNLHTSISSSHNSSEDSRNIRLVIVKQLLSQIANASFFSTKTNSENIVWFSIPFKPIVPQNTKKLNLNVQANSSTIINTIKATEPVNTETNIANSSLITIKLEEINLNYGTNTEIQKRNHTSSLSIYINIIIVDDEDLSRKAMMRSIVIAAKKKRIGINIIEAKDGSETLFKLYEAYYDKNDKIHAIISDEKMNFINGSMSLKIISKLSNSNLEIPFFIVTAFDKNANFFRGFSCNGIFSKPLSGDKADFILSDILSKLTIKNIL